MYLPDGYKGFPAPIAMSNQPVERGIVVYEVPRESKREVTYYTKIVTMTTQQVTFYRHSRVSFYSVYPNCVMIIDVR